MRTKNTNNNAYTRNAKSRLSMTSWKPKRGVYQASTVNRLHSVRKRDRAHTRCSLSLSLSEHDHCRGVGGGCTWHSSCDSNWNSTLASYLACACCLPASLTGCPLHSVCVCMRVLVVGVAQRERERTARPQSLLLLAASVAVLSGAQTVVARSLARTLSVKRNVTVNRNESSARKRESACAYVCVLCSRSLSLTPTLTALLAFNLISSNLSWEIGIATIGIVRDGNLRVLLR